MAATVKEEYVKCVAARLFAACKIGGQRSYMATALQRTMTVGLLGTKL